MKLNTMRCKECRREMGLSLISTLAGEESGLRIRIDDMPAMACAEGHRRFIAPDFAVKLMESLFKDDSLVPVERAAMKGILRKHCVCPACGNALDPDQAGTAEAKRVLELGTSKAFGVTLVMPKYCCASCGKESVPPDVWLGNAFMKASARAFQAANVAPA